MFNNAQKVKLIVLDVDGVCTDGKLYYNAQGEVTKSFYAQDGIGVKSAIRAGISIAVITGRADEAVAKRVKELGITDYYAGFESKLEPIQELRQKYQLSWGEMAYVGDDWIDLDPMNSVGYPIAVANAAEAVKNIACYVTKLKGGEGAVREAIEYIFTLNGLRSAEVARMWTHD